MEQTILDYWFGPADSPESMQQRKLWFTKDPTVDREIRERFKGMLEAAASGCFDHWAGRASGALALILLLDQFPRHIYRDSPQAFAFDDKARAVAEAAVAAGFDQLLPPVQRAFLYLPFEHSEALSDQERSVQLFGRLVADRPDLLSFYDYALRHQAIIARFGRFPHRNEWLNRPSTPEEIMFLAQPDSRF